MKHEYSITVENTPWYIECPILKRFFNTASIGMTAETFTEDGTFSSKIHGWARIQIEGRDIDWKAYLHLRYNFPQEGVGHGLRLRTIVYAVNNQPLSTPLAFDMWAIPKDMPWALVDNDSYLELKLGKKDLAERGVE